jgi:3-hydroxyacyl-CoA dehydrogenase, NAD binding domain
LSVTKTTPKLRIIGAGAMGHSIAQVAVQNGIPVVMLDPPTGAADAGRVRCSSASNVSPPRAKRISRRIPGKMVDGASLVCLASCPLLNPPALREAKGGDELAVLVHFHRGIPFPHSGKSFHVYCHNRPHF